MVAGEKGLIRYEDVYQYAFKGVHGGGLEDEDFNAIINAIDSVPQVDAVEVPETGMGDMSDGYHTFNGLYYQRMMLFAALVKVYKARAWKSYRHTDGELCFGGGWFIVGIETPEGSYTYHYENKDFDLFDCEELPVAKAWDGHTEKDVTRLLSLPVAGKYKTNGDEFRRMGDRKLAEFLAGKFADCMATQKAQEGRAVTATEMSVWSSMWFRIWMQWLRTPYEGR